MLIFSNKPTSILIIAIMIFSFANAAESKSVLKDVRISQSDNETRLVLDLTEKVKYKLFTLNRPDRIVIDLYETNLQKGLKTKIKKSGLINEIRIARNNSRRIRMVIETSEILLSVERHSKESKSQSPPSHRFKKSF